MKSDSFMQGAGVALAASLAGAALFVALTTVFAGGTVLRLVIAGLSFAYVFYLLARSGQRVGRVTTLAGWVLAAGIGWILQLPLPLYLLLHLGLIWLVRSLYFYSSALSALMDLGLTGLGLAAGIWAFLHTGSLFLGLWSFFLVQALFVVIPTTFKQGPSKSKPPAGDDAFEKAHRAAEQALGRMTSVSP
ncbi:MAG: hypothetical protein ABFS23_08090 [Pseudomonadota bacterium]